MQAPGFPIDGNRVLLCVCGGIAAYKSAELVRRLRDAGAEVQVAMTENAHRFVGAHFPWLLPDATERAPTKIL